MCNEKVIIQLVEEDMVTLPRAEYDNLRTKAYAVDSIILHAQKHTYLNDEVVRAIIGVFLAPMETTVEKSNPNSSPQDVTPHE